MVTFFAEGQDNPLTQDNPNDLFLRHKSLGTLDETAILKRMEARNLSTVNVSGATFIRQFLEECALVINEGYNVNTPLFKTMISIQKVVDRSQLGHTISSDKVTLKVNFDTGKLLADFRKNKQISIAKNLISGAPLVQRVSDPTTKEVDVLQIGGMVLVEGINIAVRGDKSGEIGVFLRHEDGDEIRISAERLYPNTPTKLQFVLPVEARAGEWKLSVTTQPRLSSTGSYSENLRTGEYEGVIFVS